MALTNPIACLVETLRRWREQERQAVTDAPLLDPAAEEVDHELNAASWFLMPPV